MKAISAFSPVFDSLFVPTDGLIELRALPSKDQAFVKPGDAATIQRFIDQHSAENQNLFFGVAARKDSTSGRLENCVCIRAVFADVDFKTFGSAAAATRRLEEFPLKPSIIVNSGNGHHPYWILNEPEDLQLDPLEFRDILRRTALALNADMSAAEPARVLRIPGTLNLKYDPPVLVTVKTHLDHVYSLADFEFLPHEPKTQSAKINSSGNGVHRDRRDIVTRAEKYLAAIPPAIEGSGGDQHTYKTCCKLVRDFGLTESEAFNLLIPWNARCEPSWTERELQEKIRNAVRYGDHPIGSKLNEEPRRSSGNGSRSCVNTTTPEPIVDSSTEHDHDDHRQNGIAGPQCRFNGDHPDRGDDDVRPDGYSDDSLADHFSEKYADELRYAPSWGWLQWTGQRWRRVSDVIVMEMARPVCRASAQLCRDDGNLRPATRESLARIITSAKTVAAVERLARGDARHYREVHQFDADLWAFNTPGGTINLKTGILGKHRRDDLITKISNATPRGDCPRWHRFLDRVTAGNAELKSYLQRLTGYGMSGDPREECIDFFHGSGGNGKGVYLTALEYAFGEYATAAGAETFVESKGDKHPCDMAKLAGARLVISNEIDEGQRWDEARIKSLTGKDVVSARFMRQDFFDFTPQFTLIIAGNHKPTLKTVDESIRRRFHLVPFTVTIPAEEQNTNLKNELQEEADGILAWALAGCLAWQRQRLNPPEIVLTATAEYLNSEDTFGQWVSEMCIQGEHEDRTSFLYESFKRWKQDRGEQPLGQKTFTTRLTERGFTQHRDMYGSKISGLRLESEERQRIEAAINERRVSEGKREWWNR